MLFLSVSANVVAPGTSEIPQFADKVRIKLISKLIKGILRVFQNCLSVSIELLELFKLLILYSSRCYIGHTTLMSLTLFTCVLFISLMHSVIYIQFFVTNDLLSFSGIYLSLSIFLDF